MTELRRRDRLLGLSQRDVRAVGGGGLTDLELPLRTAGAAPLLREGLEGIDQPASSMASARLPVCDPGVSGANHFSSNGYGIVRPSEDGGNVADLMAASTHALIVVSASFPVTVTLVTAPSGAITTFAMTMPGLWKRA